MGTARRPAPARPTSSRATRSASLRQAQGRLRPAARALVNLLPRDVGGAAAGVEAVQPRSPGLELSEQRAAGLVGRRALGQRVVMGCSHKPADPVASTPGAP